MGGGAARERLVDRVAEFLEAVAGDGVVAVVGGSDVADFVFGMARFLEREAGARNACFSLLWLLLRLPRRHGL